MKGIIFTEFIEMVESSFGLETVEELLEEAELASNGVYTSLGTYDHREILALVTALSQKTSIPVPVLVQTFGGHLISAFTRKFPEFFSAETDTLGFLTKIEGHIHQEVRKLYDDTELPTFECQYESPTVLQLLYRSHRPFGDLAHGMIEATARHYGDTIKITREDRNKENQYCTAFRIEKVDGAS